MYSERLKADGNLIVTLRKLCRTLVFIPGLRQINVNFVLFEIRCYIVAIGICESSGGARCFTLHLVLSC